MKPVFRVQPPILREKDRDVVMHTLAWAFHPIRDQVEVIVGGDAEFLSKANLPDYFDPKLADYLADAPIRVVDPAENNGPAHVLSYRAGVWPPADALSFECFDPLKIFHHTRQLQHHFIKLLPFELPYNLEPLLRLKKEGFAQANLFGSGPSLQELENQEVGSGARIICNGVALNREATARIRPHIVTGIDPLYHCGISAYSGAYIQAVRELHEKYGTIVVTRREFVPWYLDRLPAEAIVGLDYVYDQPVNLDLEDAPWLASLNGNVLCASMLPLGAFLSDTITLLGFDGRNPERSTSEAGGRYFWAHDKKSSISNWEDRIPLVNPKVFDRDYEVYHQTHEATLRYLTKTLEQSGKRILRRNRPFIAALASLPEANVPARMAG